MSRTVSVAKGGVRAGYMPEPDECVDVFINIENLTLSLVETVIRDRT